MDFARKKLGYTHKKGLDFVGRFNGRYVIGEAKFIIDTGGHQNAQFNDAIYITQAPLIRQVQCWNTIDKTTLMTTYKNESAIRKS